MENLKLIIKSLKYVKSLVPFILNFPKYYKIKKLFGTMVKKTANCDISLPAIYITCINETIPHNCQIRSVKKTYKMPGGVRADLPWVRPDDSEAASILRVVFSDFIDNIKIVPDETIDKSILSENIICIGGQTNWIFLEFVINQKCLYPIEYKINKTKKVDGYYNSESKVQFESNDIAYSYGILAVINNMQSSINKIVFISGLDATTTVETARILEKNYAKLYEDVKAKNLLKSEFYSICRFKKTKNKLCPLTFDKFFVGKINKK